MGFLDFCTRLNELTFGFHSLSSDHTDPYGHHQVPLSGLQTSHHGSGGHDYYGDPVDGFCNTPINRRCWMNGTSGNFDINTDYEKHWPDGPTREVGRRGWE